MQSVSHPCGGGDWRRSSSSAARPRESKPWNSPRGHRSVDLVAFGRTITGKVAVASFPERSVTVHVTSVVPRGTKLPDGGLHVTSGEGSALSSAVTEKVTNSPDVERGGSTWTLSKDPQQV